MCIRDSAKARKILVAASLVGIPSPTRQCVSQISGQLVPAFAGGRSGISNGTNASNSLSKDVAKVVAFLLARASSSVGKCQHLPLMRSRTT
eukprot:8893524-Karenia_brevis.AAC.1